MQKLDHEHLCFCFYLVLSGATPAYLCCYDSFDQTLCLDRERSGWSAVLLYQYYRRVTDLPHHSTLTFLFASVPLRLRTPQIPLKYTFTSSGHDLFNSGDDVSDVQLRPARSETLAGVRLIFRGRCFIWVGLL